MVDDIKMYLALPVLEEYKNLEGLITSMQLQQYQNFHLVVCINHYESWRNSPEHAHAVEDNERSLTFFKEYCKIPTTLIDHASLGKGWPKGKGGVGWARKKCMDTISDMANPQDIMVSIDADTYYPSNFLSEIAQVIVTNPKLVGLAIPYFHPLSEDDTDIHILRYELYMRHYAMQMLRIDNPYAFSALGSAMAFPVWSYRKLGGITPVKSGEDFYFMQRLVKLGQLGIWCNTLAYPSARFSNRVDFGTGPALIRGNSGDWASYPIYHPDFFDEVRNTFNTFSQWFDNEVPTPMDGFFDSRFGDRQWWLPLKKNFKTRQQFVKACEGKVDGLRILQFLRERQSQDQGSNEEVLVDTYASEFPEIFTTELVNRLMKNGILGLEINQLDAVRQALFEKENALRRARYFISL